MLNSARAEMVKKQEEIRQEQAKIIQTMTASSGEVFYILDGKLCRAENQHTYDQTMSERVKAEELRKKLSVLFFVKVDGVSYGNPLYNRKAVMASIKRLDPDDQIEALNQYFKAVEDAKK